MYLATLQAAQIHPHPWDPRSATWFAVCYLISTQQSMRNGCLANPPKSDAKLTIGGEIGRGAYGTVYEGVLDGKQVAVKIIHPYVLEASDEEQLYWELCNLPIY